ncbi:hypothetical protein Shyhy01_14530 [Streptomyces hygroscopicus subsp. hygroscopicus]|nr:hypothetical protein Shyhy01_14530 [Streptomyces hygroscopicus subsp. hygroscopicus]
MRGEEQADDDAEQSEDIGLRGAEASGRHGEVTLSVSDEPAGDRRAGGGGGTEWKSQVRSA